MAAPRVCSACRTTRLSRYNLDSVCASCTRAARASDSVSPMWLWDSQIMRQALARLDPGAALAIFRVAARLSQLALADIMGWSQSQVSLIEKGKRDTLFDLRELLHFADMVEMPRVALAPLLAGEPDASFEDDGLSELGGGEEDVDRRSFGGFVAGAAAAAVLPGITVPPRVTAAHLRYLQACADSLYSRDQAVGGAILLRQAVRHWTRARRMLDESDYSAGDGDALLRVTGALAVCVGWLAFDAGNLVLARRMYAEAHLLIDGAGDPLLTVHVLEKLSMLLAFRARIGPSRGPARQALALAERAANAARDVPIPRVQALIALRQATAASLLQDGATFQSAIGQARAELGRGSSDDDPEWVRFVGAAEITGHEIRGQACLGNTVKAVESCRKSLGDPHLAPRNRVCRHAQLAAILAESGDVASAISEGMTVLPELERVTSVRALSELRPVRVAAGKTAEDAFCARFDAVEQSLTAV